MRKSVVLPARSFTWARGRPAGGGSVLTQGLVAVRNPIGPDRFRHAFRKRILRRLSIDMRTGAKWRGRERRKLSFIDERIPRPTGRSCGEFPGIGRTLPSRHFPLNHKYAEFAHPASPDLLCPDASAACQTFGPFFRSKVLSQSLPRCAGRRVFSPFGRGLFFDFSA